MTALELRVRARRLVVIVGVALVVVIYAILSPFAALWDYLRYDWRDDIADVLSVYTRED